MMGSAAPATRTRDEGVGVFDDIKICFCLMWFFSPMQSNPERKRPHKAAHSKSSRVSVAALQLLGIIRYDAINVSLAWKPEAKAPLRSAKAKSPSLASQSKFESSQLHITSPLLLTVLLYYQLTSPATAINESSCSV